MPKLLIENVRGELLGEVHWADGQIRVVAQSDEVRAVLERLVEDIATHPTRVVTGGVRQGQFVTTEKYVRAEGPATLSVLADVILRTRVSAGSSRLIPRLEDVP
jgi:hypothetical protein